MQIAKRRIISFSVKINVKTPNICKCQWMIPIKLLFFRACIVEKISSIRWRNSFGASNFRQNVIDFTNNFKGCFQKSTMLFVLGQAWAWTLTFDTPKKLVFPIENVSNLFKIQLYNSNLTKVQIRKLLISRNFKPYQRFSSIFDSVKFAVGPSLLFEAVWLSLVLGPRLLFAGSEWSSTMFE